MTATRDNAPPAPPYDQRLAGWLVRPLVGTNVHPNHLTALSLALGLAAAALFAWGGAAAQGWAALLYMLAVFTDHTDGELARQAGKASTLGHYLDFLVGGANYTCLFCAIGYGLRGAPGGGWWLALGLAAGLANPVILTLRLAMDRHHGPAAVAHPARAGFEIEDFIYLIGPITWSLGVPWFLLPYGLGTLGYLAWTSHEYRRWSRPGLPAGPMTMLAPETDR
jgi:phosphatidylglycerophosphate synthase